MAKTQNDNVMRVLGAIALVLLLLFACDCLTKRKTVTEGFAPLQEEQYANGDEQQTGEEVKEGFEEQESNPEYNKMLEASASAFPKDQIKPAELLPGDDGSSLWASVNPAGQGELKDKNFLQSGYHIGINTVGQSLRNANLQLRSEPPNSRVAVSPFLNSSIEPDTNRKQFEIGAGC
jgi:hypothetical protein